MINFSKLTWKHNEVRHMFFFFFYYIEANIVCIIIFGILLAFNYLNIDRQEKQVKYDHVLNAFMAYFLVDSFWSAIIDGIIPKSRFAVVSIVFLVYILMAAIARSWLEYVQAYEQVPERNERTHQLFEMLPFLVATAALIMNYIIAPDTLISSTLNILPLYNVYLVAVPCIYIAAILFYTIRKAKNEGNRAEKRKHLLIGFFPLMVITGGFIQMIFFPHIPIFCFTCLILMLIFYIQSIEHRISQDPLTGLNNRGQLARYTSQPSNLHMEGRLTITIMMDIDNFKMINDTYGHAEGDKALVIVSNALKRAVHAHSFPSFICRYGGDEFIIIIHPTKREETDQMLADIRAEINKHTGDMDYSLSVSTGCDELLPQEDSFQDSIKRADMNLYLYKKSRKIGR